VKDEPGNLSSPSPPPLVNSSIDSPLTPFPPVAAAVGANAATAGAAPSLLSLSNVKDEPVSSNLPPPSEALSHSLSFSEPLPTQLPLGLHLPDKIVGVGSCVNFFDLSNYCHRMMITSLYPMMGGGLMIGGYELLCTDVPLVFKFGLEKSFRSERIGELFLPVAAWREELRPFWPEFVVFVVIPTECPCPVQFCLFSKGITPSKSLGWAPHQILNLFAGELLCSSKKLLTTRNRGDRILFTWRPLSLYLPVLSLFHVLPQEKKKIVVSGNFSPLSSLLGPNYFFFGKNEGEYSQLGWGFLHEEECDHFIQEITLVFTPSELKCKGVQVLRNPLSKIWQTAKGLV